MARVAVRRDDYEDGVLPQICALSGDRAEVLVEHRSAAGIGPAGLLLLVLGPVGVVALIILDRTMSVEARGLIPMSRAQLAERKGARRRCSGVALAGLLAVAVGVGLLTSRSLLGALPSAVMGLGALLAVGGWVMPLLTGISGRPDKTGRSVELTGVSPEFARAYRAQDERRAEARRQAAATPTAPVVPEARHR